jgi:hypothetical protein
MSFISLHICLAKKEASVLPSTNISVWGTDIFQMHPLSVLCTLLELDYCIQSLSFQE